MENRVPHHTNDDLPNLRAMGFTDLLDTTLNLYRKHFCKFLGISSGYCVALLILISTFLFDDSVGRGAKVAIWITTVVVFWGISVFVISGLICASAEAYLGRRIGVFAVLRQGGRRFWVCFSGSLLFVLLAILLIFLFSFLSVSIIRTFAESASDVVDPLLLLLIMVFVTGWLGNYWCFFAAAVLVEKKSIREGIGRSGELIHRYWWQVVGMMFAILLLHFSIGYIFRIAFGVLLSLTGFVDVMTFLKTINLSALWQFLSMDPELSLSDVLIFLINLSIDTFTAPISVIAGTLLYFNQRIRKEGFDIEIMATRQGK